MASITIRNLDDAIKTRLRIQAVEHGRSMEEEAREILKQALVNQKNLHCPYVSRFAALNPEPIKSRRLNSSFSCGAGWKPARDC